MARAEAIALCDLANDQAEAMGLVGRWHAEYVA
jgi:hypothetical protein